MLSLRSTRVDSSMTCTVRLSEEDGLIRSLFVCKWWPDLQHYHAFGLRIASELALPELNPGHGPADVAIHYRQSVNPALADWDDWLTVSADTVSVRFHDMQFRIEGGRSIDIETSLATPARDARMWLMGSVMAALLHQRGYLPIHANVVALGGDQVAAFAGESGAGKSSLAAWFEARGHRVLADDLCAIRLCDDGTPVAFEGIPRMKLWRDTLTALGRESEGLEPVSSGLDKYHVALQRSGEEGSLAPLDLQRIYLLDRAAKGDGLTIEPVFGAEAASGVLDNAFRWQIGQMIQPPRAQFDQCLALARHAAVFRIKRRWGMQWFAEEALAIERHLAAPVAEARRA